MTKTKIVTLLSVLVLLASLPLTVALAQGAPYLVMGTAMVDDEPAMMGTTVVAMVDEDEVGSGEVFDEMGRYLLMIDRGREGDTVMISLTMGEGDEAMEHMTMTEEDVMIGLSGERRFADLMAYTGDPPPAAAPTMTAAQEHQARRGPRGFQGLQGTQGEAGLAGAEGTGGPAGPAGADGSAGPSGAEGARGPAGLRGEDGTAGSDGPAGSFGAAGLAGPAGTDGATGAAGATGFIGEAGAAGEAGGGGMIAMVALFIAIIGVAAGAVALITGRKSSSS